MEEGRRGGVDRGIDLGVWKRSRRVAGSLSPRVPDGLQEGGRERPRFIPVSRPRRVLEVELLEPGSRGLEAPS